MYTINGDEEYLHTKPKDVQWQGVKTDDENQGYNKTPDSSDFDIASDHEDTIDLPNLKDDSKAFSETYKHIGDHLRDDQYPYNGETENLIGTMSNCTSKEERSLSSEAINVDEQT